MSRILELTNKQILLPVLENTIFHQRLVLEVHIFSHSAVGYNQTPKNTKTRNLYLLPFLTAFEGQGSVLGPAESIQTGAF